MEERIAAAKRLPPFVKKKQKMLSGQCCKIRWFDAVA
jgi:hypothetical protein